MQIRYNLDGIVTGVIYCCLLSSNQRNPDLRADFSSDNTISAIFESLEIDSNLKSGIWNRKSGQIISGN